jgi:bifunctional DNase/RNase
MGMREMTVFGVSFDIVGKQPIVLLKTQDENKFLPIWIGHPEAAAILMKLQGSSPPRPMTHDLLTSILEQLEAEIVQIAVTELRENTFYAQITIVQNGQEIAIDSRPSDAIALAVRADARIFASDEVIEESGIEFEGGDEEAQSRIARVSELADLDPDEFRRFLDTVTPEQFAEGLAEAEEEDGEEA